MKNMNRIVIKDGMTKEMILNDKDIRNSVAGAHGCYTANSTFRYKLAVVYPSNYIVTENLIESAKKVQ